MGTWGKTHTSVSLYRALFCGLRTQGITDENHLGCKRKIHGYRFILSKAVQRHVCFYNTVTGNTSATCKKTYKLKLQG